MANPYLPTVQQAASRYGVRPNLLASLIQHESNFNPSARSPAGAVGIAQFMPTTAAGMGINPLNPRQAIFGAAKYLSGLIKQFGGSERLGLAAYNAGSGAVRRYGGVPPYAETQAYVRNVLGGAGQYPGLAAGGGGTAGVDAKLAQARALLGDTHGVAPLPASLNELAASAAQSKQFALNTI